MGRTRLPKPRVSAKTWKAVTGYDPRDRPFLLLVWQDAPDLGRVFLVPSNAVPEAWLSDLWMTHGVYLENERKHGTHDTITSMVRLIALLTWPSHERCLKHGKVRVLHTNLEYPVRDLVGAWNTYQVPAERFSRVKSSQVATTIRTGRWPPSDTPDV